MRVKKTRWQSCNVLHLGSAEHQLWHFATGTGSVTLQGDPRVPPGQRLPARAIAKDWRTLGQRKLNIAWLPPEHVYLQMVRLPKSDPAEVPAMLELQLEKLSPLPVNQIVWSYEMLSSSAEDLQTAVLLIVERSHVESFLGRLEAEGYLADRLELPWLHQLAAQPPDEEGAWIYLHPHEGNAVCLVAWYYGGAYRCIHLVPVPGDERGPRLLAEHLNRTAWAGEIEGWLTTAPRWHLAVLESLVPSWEPGLQPLAQEALRVYPSPTPASLSALAAERACRGESTANLLPPGYAARYHQQFVDRLWMRGLGALVVVYLFLVGLYFVGLQVLDYQRRRMEKQAASLKEAYTNALRLQERVRLFQEQVNLRYAALDCLRVAAELLPPELTLTSFNFQGGKTLFLAGTVARENQVKVAEYNTELRKASVNGVPLFDKANVKETKLNAQPGGATFRWDFSCDLYQPNL